MSSDEKAQKYTAGQIAAARLLLKREKEGKATIPITDRVRKTAAYGGVPRLHRCGRKSRSASHLSERIG